MRQQITQYYCDICHTPVSQYRHSVRLFNGKKALDEHKNEEYDGHETVELCITCQSKLLDFIKSGKDSLCWK